ncbi:MAG: hypothetical protein ACFCUS_14275 [Rubrimonas sp.]
MPDEFYWRALLIIFDEMLHGSGDALAAAQRAGRWWNAATRLGTHVPRLIETYFGLVSCDGRLQLAYKLLADAPQNFDACSLAIAPLDQPCGPKSFDVTRRARAAECARVVGIMVQGVRTGFERGESLSLTSALKTIEQQCRKRTDSRELNAIGLSRNSLTEVFQKLRPVLPLCEGYAHGIEKTGAGVGKDDQYQLGFAFAADSFDRLSEVTLPRTDKPVFFEAATGLRVIMETLDKRVERAIQALDHPNTSGADRTPGM